ncbi:DUF5392 family protein [Pullulanibacillus sp. KACC 23026]|uniref:DUF5392 family protein n=1 Tax=Pullulanibacillus sp. KACC 23026 TaxID=3028315 RepID=UPI0023B12742|nr:DUF5392 family protein [Pullulanibacillus sp. KACC 23026]WEG14567.1 DUF5392 family protein [Pullulanibacillus sp. KACC 23026]
MATRPEIPRIVKNELEKLGQVIGPLLKRISGYRFWSIPFLSISIFNLFTLLVLIPQDQTRTALIIYAILGAIGLAMLRESNVLIKEVRKKSLTYILERISASSDTTVDQKQRYLLKIRKSPPQAFEVFIDFLEEEIKLMDLEDQS